MKSIWPACLELLSLLLSNLDGVVNIHVFIGNISWIYVDKTFEISLKGINGLLQILSDASLIIFIAFSSPFCFFFMKFLWLWYWFFSHIVKIFQHLWGNGKALAHFFTTFGFNVTPTIPPGPFTYLKNVVLVNMSDHISGVSWHAVLSRTSPILHKSMFRYFYVFVNFYWTFFTTK